MISTTFVFEVSIKDVHENNLKKRVLSSNTGHFKSEFLEKNNSRSVQYLGI